MKVTPPRFSRPGVQYSDQQEAQFRSRVERALKTFAASISGLEDNTDIFTEKFARLSTESVGHPTIPYDETVKAYQYIDANTYYAFVPNAGATYSLIIFRNNITTVADSLASTTSDTTPFRMTAVLDAVEVIVGHSTASATNGTWSTTSLIVGIPTYDAGDFYEYNQSSTIGAWIEFEIDVPDDGYFNVGFVMGASASGDVTVSVDGSAVDSNFSIVSPSGARQWIKEYTTTPGTRTIRITNNTAGSTGLNVMGVNVFPLRKARTDVDLDQLGYYRNSARLQPVVANSANDYAIRRFSDGIYGGSYHGGETSITNTVLVDRVATTVSSGFVVTKDLELESTSTIDWGDGDALDVVLRHIFHLGGYTVTTQFDGDVTVDQIFATLIGFNEEYTDVVAPKQVTISTLEDRERKLLGNENAVELAYAPTGQRVKVTHSLYADVQNEIGGVFLWKVVGTYNKYYAAPVWGTTSPTTPRRITQFHSRTVVQVS